MKLFALSHRAKSDLINIGKYTLKTCGLAQRNRYLKQLDDAFELLGKTPTLGTTCDEVFPDYRKFLQGSHLIFYKLHTVHGIFIVRILHQRMDYRTINISTDQTS